MSMFNKLPVGVKDLLKRAGSPDQSIALAAQYDFAKAIELPISEALLAQDIVNGIYQTVNLTNGESLEYPMDILNPGDEDDFMAYVNPGHGRIPERQVEADYVILRTYMLANSIDTTLRVVRDSNWDILGRMIEIMKAGFVRKMNIDGWHTILASGASRNTIIYDSAATAGVMSRRLISLLEIEMRRQGGKFTTLKNRKVTHLYLSPEAKHDIYNWTITEIDDVTRRDLYMLQSSGGVSKLLNLFLVDLNEFGVGEEHNDYFTVSLGQALPGSKVEIVVGLDLSNPSFIMPVRENLVINNDQFLHRNQKVGFYGWLEGGFAALDNRDVLVGAL